MIVSKIIDAKKAINTLGALIKSYTKKAGSIMILAGINEIKAFLICCFVINKYINAATILIINKTAIINN